MVKMKREKWTVFLTKLHRDWLTIVVCFDATNVNIVFTVHFSMVRLLISDINTFGM